MIFIRYRELLVHCANPYSRQLDTEIQAAFYGAPLPPGDDREKECCFVYPVYVTFLLAPGLETTFSTFSRVVLWLLALATAASVACWWAATRRGATSPWRAIPLVVVSPPVAQALELRQLALLVVALLVVALLSLPLLDRKQTNPRLLRNPSP